MHEITVVLIVAFAAKTLIALTQAIIAVAKSRQ